MTPGFEWDPRKAAANLAKHGVSFEEAASAFEDEFALYLHDPDHSASEERFILLGLSNMARLLVVVHCERPPFDGGDRPVTIRIISARQAERDESRSYSERNTP